MVHPIGKTRNENKRSVPPLDIVGVRAAASSKCVIRRIFWLTLICFAVAFYTYHIYRRIKHFTSQPVNTVYKVTSLPKIALPAITLCNNNLLIQPNEVKELVDFLSETCPEYFGDVFREGNSQKLHDEAKVGPCINLIIISDEYYEDSDEEDGCPRIGGFPQRLKWIAKGKYHYLEWLKATQNVSDATLDAYKNHILYTNTTSLEELYFSSNNWYDILEALGHPVVYPSCTFGGVPCERVFHESTVKHTQIYEFGKCLTLNLDQILVQSIPGSIGGLSVTLWALSDLYPTDTTYRYPIRYGYGIFIHHKDDIPWSYTTVEVGKTYRLVISQHSTELRKKCVNVKDITLRHFNSSRYTVNKCLADQIWSATEESLKCSLPGLESFADNISDVTSKTCVPSYWRSWVSYGDIPQKINSSNCPTPCKSTFYNTQNIVAQDHLYTADPDLDIFLKNNMIQLNIHYSQISETSLEENIDFDWLAMLADVGGASGLFLGACIFSVIQILEYGFIETLKCFKKSYTKHRKGVQPTVWSGDSSYEKHFHRKIKTTRVIKYSKKPHLTNKRNQKSKVVRPKVIKYTDDDDRNFDNTNWINYWLQHHNAEQ